MPAASPRFRRPARPILLAAAGVLVTLAAAALFWTSGLTPAAALSLAQTPDAQIAVFMLPLSLLVLAILFEVTRMSLRGRLPDPAPARRVRPLERP